MSHRHPPIAPATRHGGRDVHTRFDDLTRDGPSQECIRIFRSSFLLFVVGMTITAVLATVHVVGFRHRRGSISSMAIFVIVVVVAVGVDAAEIPSAEVDIVEEGGKNSLFGVAIDRGIGI